MDLNSYLNTKTNLRLSQFQQKFRRDLFIKSIQNEKPLFNKLIKFTTPTMTNTPVNISFITELGEHFDTLIKLLTESDTIQRVQKVIDKYYLYYNSDINISKRLDAKKFLCFYTILGYPEFVLTLSKSDIGKLQEGLIEKDIHVICQKLFVHIANLLTSNTHTEHSIRKFNKSMNMYSNAFVAFLNIDKLKKIDELTKKWHYTYKTIKDVRASAKYDEPQKKDTLTVLEKNLKTTERFIRSLDKKFDLNILIKYSDLNDRFEKQMRKAFWDLLKKELDDGVHDRVLNLIREIRDEISKLTPKNNTFNEKFTKIYNYEYIESLIVNGELNGNKFLDFSSFIVSVIITLQSPIRNKDTRSKWKDIHYNIANENVESWGEVYENVLGFLLKKIQEIKDDIINLHVLNNFGIDIFNL
jgi:hypothetical protein